MTMQTVQRRLVVRRCNFHKYCELVSPKGKPIWRKYDNGDEYWFDDNGEIVYIRDSSGSETRAKDLFRLRVN